MIGEDAVELCLETGVEPFAELRRRFVAERDEVATHENRLGRGSGHAQTLRRGREPCEVLAAGRAARQRAGASLVVRMRHAQETVDAPHLEGEPADRRVARLRPPQRKRLHVLLDERRHLAQDALLVREAAEERKRGRHAGRVVSARADVSIGVVRGRGRLAEVMAEDGEADDEVVVPFARAVAREGVERATRVVPHIPFGMPLRILPAPDEALQFGIVLHPSRLAQERETAADLHAFHEQFRPLLEETFGRQVLGRDGAADGDGLRRGVESKPRDELHAAQHAERVFAELLGDVPQHAVREVARAAVRVDQLVRERVVVDCVHGEVAAARRLGNRQERIGGDVESLVPEAALRLAARKGDVDVEVLDLEDAEGKSHEVKRVRLPEDALEVVRREAEHLDVHVLHVPSAQEVA